MFDHTSRRDRTAWTVGMAINGGAVLTGLARSAGPGGGRGWYLGWVGFTGIKVGLTCLVKAFPVVEIGSGLPRSRSAGHLPIDC